MPNRPYDMAAVAEVASQKLATMSIKAGKIAQGIGVFALAAGLLAYCVGLFAFPSSSRPTWALVGIICFVPAGAAFLARHRVRRVRDTIPETAAELRALTSDRKVRDALAELADRNDEVETTTTPLIKLGKELNTLRRAVSGHREQLFDAWQNIVALTTLPGLLALATLGSLALLVFSAVAVVVRLLLGTG